MIITNQMSQDHRHQRRASESVNRHPWHFESSRESFGDVKNLAFDESSLSRKSINILIHSVLIIRSRWSWLPLKSKAVSGALFMLWPDPIKNFSVKLGCIYLRQKFWNFFERNSTPKNFYKIGSARSSPRLLGTTIPRELFLGILRKTALALAPEIEARP